MATAATAAATAAYAILGGITRKTTAVGCVGRRRSCWCVWNDGNRRGGPVHRHGRRIHQSGLGFRRDSSKRRNKRLFTFSPSPFLFLLTASHASLNNMDDCGSCELESRKFRNHQEPLPSQCNNVKVRCHRKRT